MLLKTDDLSSDGLLFFLFEVKKLQRDPNFAPLEDTGNEEKIGSLRHDRMTLELEAQIVRAKVSIRFIAF